MLDFGFEVITFEWLELDIPNLAQSYRSMNGIRRNYQN